MPAVSGWGLPEEQRPSIRKPGGEQKVGRFRTEGKLLTEGTRRPVCGAQRGRTERMGISKAGPCKDSVENWFLLGSLDAVGCQTIFHPHFICHICT